MRIVFIQNLSLSYSGITYISAVLKKHGHSTDVVVEELNRDLVKDVCQAKPDIVGFTCITGDHQWVGRRAAEIKKHLNIPIIVGGPHPTYFPDMIEMENIDIIARGEAENIVLELMNCLQNRKEINNIAGLWVKEDKKIYKNAIAPLIQDLDVLPFPDRDIYDKYAFLKEETEFQICISRGCHFDCSFCYNASKKKIYLDQKVVRKRSIDNIISEIKFLQQRYPNLKSISFNDDNLGLDSKWFNEFCEKYSQLNPSLPFIASLRADFINEERAKRLKKANCFCVTIGLESGNAEMRKNILKKNISDKTFILAARLIKENGIKLRTSSMCFLPGETIEMGFETLRLNKKMKVNYAWIYPLQPYPGTEIYQYAVENGFLDKEFSFDDIDPLGILKSPLERKLKDGKKLKVLHRLFYYGIKIPGFVYLLKLLVYLPNNFIFELLHRFSLLINYAKFHKINLFHVFMIASRAFLVERKIRILMKTKISA